MKCQSCGCNVYKPYEGLCYACFRKKKAGNMHRCKYCNNITKYEDKICAICREPVEIFGECRKYKTIKIVFNDTIKTYIDSIKSSDPIFCPFTTNEIISD